MYECMYLCVLRIRGGFGRKEEAEKGGTTNRYLGSIGSWCSVVDIGVTNRWAWMAGIDLRSLWTIGLVAGR